MAMPTFQASGAISSGTVVWPTHQTNDIGILIVYSGSSITTPTGWTVISNGLSYSSPNYFGVFWKRAASSSEANFAGPGNYQAITTYRNCITTVSPIALTPTRSTSMSAGLTFSVPTITTTVDNQLILITGNAWRTTTGTQTISSITNANLTNIGLRQNYAPSTSTDNIFLGDGGKASAGLIGASTINFLTSATHYICAMQFPLIGTPDTGGGGKFFAFF